MTEGGKPYSPVEKLNRGHDLDGFQCGRTELDQFLRRFAFVSQQAGSAQTYVVCGRDGRVVGYYSLSVGAVEHTVAPDRVRRGLARHPIPVMLLTRLAVNVADQGRGLGRALLKDALLRTSQAADIAGIRALLVHAKDNEARSWYASFDFEASPTDPLHLFLLMKDLRSLL